MAPLTARKRRREKQCTAPWTQARGDRVPKTSGGRGRSGAWGQAGTYGVLMVLVAATALPSSPSTDTCDVPILWPQAPARL